MQQWGTSSCRLHLRYYKGLDISDTSLLAQSNFNERPCFDLAVLYFIDYNVHVSIVCTYISKWFSAKKKNNPCKFIHHKSHLKPFLSYLPCIVRRECFSIIFNVKMWALYFIKYSKLRALFFYYWTKLAPDSLSSDDPPWPSSTRRPRGSTRSRRCSGQDWGLAISPPKPVWKSARHPGGKTVTDVEENSARSNYEHY